MSQFAANLKKLPGISHLAALNLLDADGRCVFGATVDIEDQDSGDGVTYQIVGEDEANIKIGKLSVASPMARAYLQTPDIEIPRVLLSPMAILHM